MSTSGSGLKSTIPPTHQPDATINQANPVSAQLYEVLATTANARIYHITAVCIWTVQPTPLEAVLTIDGQTLTHIFANPASTTNYEAQAYPQAAENAQILAAIGPSQYRSFYIEGKSVRVQVRITGGTVQNLSARVKYGKW